MKNKYSNLGIKPFRKGLCDLGNHTYGYLQPVHVRQALRQEVRQSFGVGNESLIWRWWQALKWGRCKAAATRSISDTFDGEDGSEQAWKRRKCETAATRSISDTCDV